MAETTPQNPYNQKTQEGRYMNWENGFNSRSENDCPYDADDSDNRELLKVWKAGFRANPAHKEAKATPDVQQAPEAVKSVLEVNVAGLPTELLELELKKRKIQELQQLSKQEAELTNKLQQVQQKIQRLSILLGD